MTAQEIVDQDSGGAGRSQSEVVQLDVIDLRTILRAMGTTLPAFVAKLEKRLTKGEQPA